MDKLLMAKEFAANWIAERFLVADKREQLRRELLRRIPDSGDWELYNDYDPRGILLDAVQAVVPCRGWGFSGDDLFPRKTGIWKTGAELTAKEGYANILGVVFRER